jgi:hypothetical protein
MSYHATHCYSRIRETEDRRNDSEIPGQAQGAELGALPLGFERVGKVRCSEAEDETAMSHGMPSVAIPMKGFESTDRLSLNTVPSSGDMCDAVTRETAGKRHGPSIHRPYTDR